MKSSTMFEQFGNISMRYIADAEPTSLREVLSDAAETASGTAPAYRHNRVAAFFSSGWFAAAAVVVVALGMYGVLLFLGHGGFDPNHIFGRPEITETEPETNQNEHSDPESETVRIPDGQETKEPDMETDEAETLNELPTDMMLSDEDCRAILTSLLDAGKNNRTEIKATLYNGANAKGQYKSLQCTRAVGGDELSVDAGDLVFRLYRFGSELYLDSNSGFFICTLTEEQTAEVDALLANRFLPMTADDFEELSGTIHTLQEGVQGITLTEAEFFLSGRVSQALVGRILALLGWDRLGLSADGCTAEIAMSRTSSADDVSSAFVEQLAFYGITFTLDWQDGRQATVILSVNRSKTITMIPPEQDRKDVYEPKPFSVIREIVTSDLAHPGTQPISSLEAAYADTHKVLGDCINASRAETSFVARADFTYDNADFAMDITPRTFTRHVIGANFCETVTSGRDGTLATLTFVDGVLYLNRADGLRVQADLDPATRSILLPDWYSLPDTSALIPVNTGKDALTDFSAGEFLRYTKDTTLSAALLRLSGVGSQAFYTDHTFITDEKPVVYDHTMNIRTGIPGRVTRITGQFRSEDPYGSWDMINSYYDISFSYRMDVPVAAPEDSGSYTQISTDEMAEIINGIYRFGLIDFVG